MFMMLLNVYHSNIHVADALLLSKPLNTKFTRLNKSRNIPISFQTKQINYTKLKSSNNNNDIKSSLPTPGAIQEFFEIPVIEISLILLVLLSSLLVAINTIPWLSMDYINMNNAAQEIITILFAVEFVLRWYAADMKPSYFLKPLTLIDIVVVIIPLALKLSNAMPELSHQSGLINLLLLRILRLQRVIVDTETFSKYLIALGFKATEIRPYQLQLARVVLSIFTLLSVSTGLIYSAEHEVNPAIPDYFTALYFGLTTLTTVGFGDITPVTFQGRLIVCGSILLGVAVIPAQAAALVEALLDLQNERLLKKKEEDAKTKSCFTFPNFNTATTASATTKSQYAIVTPECDPDDDDCEEDDDFLLDMKRSCANCGVKSHRVDALFCWNCGSGVANDAVNNTSVQQEAFS